MRDILCEGCNAPGTGSLVVGVAMGWMPVYGEMGRRGASERRGREGEGKGWDRWEAWIPRLEDRMDECNGNWEPTRRTMGRRRWSQSQSPASSSSTCLLTSITSPVTWCVRYTVRYGVHMVWDPPLQ